jgi:hypothetical protein
VGSEYVGRKYSVRNATQLLYLVFADLPGKFCLSNPRTICNVDMRDLEINNERVKSLH